MERKDGRVLRRMTLYFDPLTGYRLKVFCAAAEREASSVVTEAVAAYLDSKGA